MARGSDLEALIRRFDRQLSGLENTAIRSLKRALRESQTRLENELRRLYTAALNDTATAGSALAEARARVLLEQVRAALQVLRGVPVETILGNITRDAYAAGAENALAALTASQIDAVALSAIVRVDVAARATNAAARLAHHGAEFASKAEQIIIDGIVRGRGWSTTARELRRATGATARHAETIVRTESLIASDTARRETYRENGVEYVQRMATMDSRVCGYCAYRAGNVYRVDEAPAALHPNDRCYNAPWRPEWAEMGFGDEEWFSKHKEESLARTQDRAHTGAAPFERSAGVQPPQPVWSPHVDQSRVASLRSRYAAARPVQVRRTARRPLPPATPTQLRREYLNEWVHGSRRRGSTVLKQAVKEELGAPGVVYSTREFNIGPSDIARARTAVRTTYEETQASLAGRGPITLYRGARTTYDTPGVLESWTTDIDVARRFAGRNGRILVEEVPADRIFAYRGGPGWRDGKYGNQSEWIVMPDAPRR